MAASSHLSKSAAPPLIARFLRDEVYFRNGPPNWPNAPTSKDAKEARISAKKRLRRFASDFSEAKPLANILARCKPRRRCMSGACPECGRAFQRWFVNQVESLMGNANSGMLYSISVVPPQQHAKEDKLASLDPKTLKRSISEAVNNTNGIFWMAGGVDLSLNDDTQKKSKIAWQPQLYTIALADSEKLSTTLRKKYRPSKVISRPVQIKSCDGSAKAISYAYKTYFVRRIAYRVEIGPPDKRRKCWHTRKVSLRPREHVRAMLWMHQIGLAGRLFLRGLRMTRIGNGVGLVQLKMKKLE